MTVKELIEKLQELPPDSEIAVADETGFRRMLGLVFFITGKYVLLGGEGDRF